VLRSCPLPSCFCHTPRVVVVLLWLALSVSVAAPRCSSPAALGGAPCRGKGAAGVHQGFVLLVIEAVVAQEAVAGEGGHLFADELLLRQPHEASVGLFVLLSQTRQRGVDLIPGDDLVGLFVAFGLVVVVLDLELAVGK